MANVKPGDLLAGKYRVDRVLGEGGMGVVVAATHVQLEERYALKFMLPSAMENPEIRSRFLQEAKASARLKSEHIARVHDVGTLDSGAPYIVMEYLEGEDLAHVLATRGPLSPCEIADYVLQACDAVAEAHARGIIHRDLKPANLFVTRGPDNEPLVKVLDFGISKASALNDTSVSKTRSSVLLGSPLYMSPEQMKSARDVSPAADLWSIGVILYEAVGGRVPYDAGTVGALMAKILTEMPAPLHTVRHDVPADFAALVARCLQREPSHRYANVGDLAKALAPFASRRLHPLVDRIARVLESSHVPAPRLSGLEATLADSSGPLPQATGSTGRGVGTPVTASGWGTTANGRPSRRWLAIALGGLLVCGVTVGLTVLAMRAGSGRLAVASGGPPAGTAPSAAASSPSVGTVSAVTAPPSASAGGRPGAVAAAIALSPPGASAPASSRVAPLAKPATRPPPRPTPAVDAFGDSRK